MTRAIGAALCLLALGGNALAGCGFYGYGGYGKSYGHGGSYWPGGYFSGGYGYKAGYYSAGYYPSYGNDYGYNVYETPVFVKYKAVVPLVELPTYGAYYQTYQQPPAMPAAPASAPAAAASAGADIGGKLDKLLTLTEQTSSRVIRLEARVDAIEGRGTPRPPAAPAPAATTPTAPADVPTLLYNRCAACHESKVAAKLGGRLVLFVAGESGAELAALGADGKPAPLPARTLQRVEKSLADGSMPPKEDATGRPVQGLTADERRAALEVVREALKSGPAK